MLWPIWCNAIQRIIRRLASSTDGGVLERRPVALVCPGILLSRILLSRPLSTNLASFTLLEMKHGSIIGIQLYTFHQVKLKWNCYKSLYITVFWIVFCLDSDVAYLDCWFPGLRDVSLFSYEFPALWNSSIYWTSPTWRPGGFLLSFWFPDFSLCSCSCPYFGTYSCFQSFLKSCPLSIINILSSRYLIPFYISLLVS